MGFNAELMYPSHVMKLTSFSEGQHDAQNGTITYLTGYETSESLKPVMSMTAIEKVLLT